MSKGIIYKIICNINNKIYIGKRKQLNIDNYWGSGKLIKLAIQKYGLKNFSKQILETTDFDKLNVREKYFINLYNSTDRNIGYNISIGGEGGAIIKQMENCKEIYKQIAHKNSGKKRSNLQIQNIKNGINSSNKKHNKSINKNNKSFMHKTHKQISKDKIQISNKNNFTNPKTDIDYKLSIEHRNNISKALKNKIKSEDHKQKLSKAQKGKKPGNALIVIFENRRFIGMHDASITLNINYSTLRNRLKSKNIHFANIYLESNKKIIINNKVYFESELIKENHVSSSS